MKNALHYQETIKIHIPNFVCDIGGGSDYSSATYQCMPAGPKPKPSGPTGQYQYLGIFVPFHLERD